MGAGASALCTLCHLSLTAIYKAGFLVVPCFTDDELGFDKNPAPGSDRMQGWHSNLG